MGHGIAGVPEMTPEALEACVPIAERIVAELRQEAARLGVHPEAGGVTLAVMIAGRAMAELTGSPVSPKVIEYGAQMVAQAVYSATLVEHAAIYSGGPRT